MSQNKKTFIKAVGDSSDPQGLLAFMQRYLDALRIKFYTQQTLHNNERYLRDFIAWCDARCYQQCKNDPLQQLKSDPVQLTLVLLDKHHDFKRRAHENKSISQARDVTTCHC